MQEQEQEEEQEQEQSIRYKYIHTIVPNRGEYVHTMYLRKTIAKSISDIGPWIHELYSVLRTACHIPPGQFNNHNNSIQ